MAIPVVLRLFLQTEAARQSLRGFDRALVQEAGQIAGRVNQTVKNIVGQGLVQGANVGLLNAARTGSFDTGLAARGFATGALQAAREEGFVGKALVNPIVGPVLDRKQRVGQRLISDFGDLVAAGAKVSPRVLEGYRKLYETQEERRQTFIEDVGAQTQLSSEDFKEIMGRLGKAVDALTSVLKKVL